MGSMSSAVTSIGLIRSDRKVSRVLAKGTVQRRSRDVSAGSR
jgi:hypothetical protein